MVGIGLSGLAVARFLARRGVRVRACDLRAPEKLASALGQLPPETETVVGGYDERVLEGCAAVYASPAVPWDDPLLEEARRRELAVSSEIDLFFRHCPAAIVASPGPTARPPPPRSPARSCDRARGRSWWGETSARPSSTGSTS